MNMSSEGSRSAESKLAEHSQRLLQLRIEPGKREPQSAPVRNRWLLVGIPLVVLSIIVVAAVSVLDLGRLEIETTTAVVPPRSSAPLPLLQATGYVTARRQATVSAQITGTVTNVMIEEGEFVRKGQILTQLDDAAQLASLAEAQAQLKAAQAVLEQYEAQLAQAARELRRSEDLVARQLASKQALEKASTEVATLRSQVKSQQGQVELAIAAVKSSEVQLNYTTVRAPFSGVIVAKTVQTGEIISPMSAGGGFTRTGVATIVDMGSLEIEVDVNEAFINRVLTNQAAEATLNAYPQWSIPARVVAIVPTADRSKATVKVRVAIEQNDPRILPDMGVRVSFLGEALRSSTKLMIGEVSEPKADGVLVPSSAIVKRSGISVIFVVKGEHAHTRQVMHIKSYGDLELVEGVAKGETVVRMPPVDMTDGARIVVRSIGGAGP